MANKSIDQLPAADSVSSSDLLMVETSGGTKKATKAQIAPTVDSSPTSGSSNAVSSGGVYTALGGKVNTTDTIAVSKGGTGQTTLTSNSVLVGNGTTAVKQVPSASGALYAASANAEPSFGTLPVAQGGTGATSAATARTNLGLGTSSTVNTTTSVTSGATTVPTAGAVYNYTKQVYISSTAPSSNQSNYLWVKPS